MNEERERYILRKIIKENYPDEIGDMTKDELEQRIKELEEVKKGEKDESAGL